MECMKKRNIVLIGIALALSCSLSWAITKTPAKDITVVPAGTITATDVQAALQEIDSGKQPAGSYVPTSTTVNGHALTGNISVTASDVGLGNVNNTSDLNKPISTATQTALNGKQVAGSYLTAESDPVYAESEASGITALLIAAWNQAVAWGNHATEGYLKAVDWSLGTTANMTGINWSSFVTGTPWESEGYLTSVNWDEIPIIGVGGIDWSGVVEGTLTGINWDDFIRNGQIAAVNWDEMPTVQKESINWTGVDQTVLSSVNWDAFLTAETDPVYSASSWATTTNRSTNWDTAYSWGDWSGQGFITQAGINWNAFPNAQGFITALGVNWDAFPNSQGYVTQSGINWTDVTLVTPTLGVASATSLAVPTITTASGALGITPASGSNLNVTLGTTGDLAVNTSQLYVDTSEARVGINTATPSAPLTVSSTVTVAEGTGGTITRVGGKTIHTFTTTGAGTFVAPVGVTAVEVLVIGGGGGSGRGNGSIGANGGGGAGEAAYISSYAISEGSSYALTVGAGGTGRTGSNGVGGNGGDSVFNDITAKGGGGGAAGVAGLTVGITGGSGGGGATGNGGGVSSGTGTATRYLNVGGNSSTPANPGGGGGGGATQVGANSSGNAAGNGGAGLTDTISGSSVCRAGGGGGSSNAGTAGGTATCGGGAGSTTANTQGTAGTANTGGGAGASGYASQNGVDGGSGVVIISYATPSAPTTIVANGRVGVNQANPAGMLTVKGEGTTTAVNLLLTNSADSALLTVLDSGAATFTAGVAATSFTIGANSLTTSEWAFLDGQDQAVKTTSSPTFSGGTTISKDVTTDFTIQNTTNTGRSAIYLKQAAGNRAGFFFYDKAYATSNLQNDLRIYLDSSGDILLDHVGNMGFTLEPAEKFTLGASHKIGWEASAGTVDTNLYRSAANTLKTDDNFTSAGTITSSNASDIGWSIVTGANTACNTTCTSACVHGWDTASGEVAVACTDATADKCLCAGAN